MGTRVSAADFATWKCSPEGVAWRSEQDRFLSLPQRVFDAEIQSRANVILRKMATGDGRYRRSDATDQVDLHAIAALAESFHVAEDGYADELRIDAQWRLAGPGRARAERTRWR